MAATFSPKAMPTALAASSGTFSSVAAKAASIRVFWPGYCRMRMSRAADAAAATAEALEVAGMSGVKRVYRFWTALTASDMDTCMIARVRVHGFPATLTAFMTSIAAWFQSVITSALDGVAVAIRARPAIAVLSALIVASPTYSNVRGRGSWKMTSTVSRWLKCAAAALQMSVALQT